MHLGLGRARRQAGAITALLAAASVGCTAAEPVVAAPELPPAAAKDSEQGATTFATHWMDLVEHGHATLDAGPMRPLVLPSCRTCARYIAQLNRDRARGMRYDGGAIRVLNAEPSGYTKSSRAEVGVVFEEDELRVLDAGGTVLETVPKQTLIFVFDLRWTERGWRAAHVRMMVDDERRPAPK